MKKHLTEGVRINKFLAVAGICSRREADKYIEAGNKEEAQAALPCAISAVDRAYTKGIFHKNAAARKKAQLSIKLNKIGA